MQKQLRDIVKQDRQKGDKVKIRYQEIIISNKNARNGMKYTGTRNNITLN